MHWPVLADLAISFFYFLFFLIFFWMSLHSWPKSEKFKPLEGKNAALRICGYESVSEKNTTSQDFPKTSFSMSSFSSSFPAICSFSHSQEGEWVLFRIHADIFWLKLVMLVFDASTWWFWMWKLESWELTRATLRAEEMNLKLIFSFPFSLQM